MDRETAGAIADRLAERLASPCDVRAMELRDAWWPQSLAVGAAGIALLHIERAHAGLGPWERVHEWLVVATADGVSAGKDAHLHYGAPALAFALQAASGGRGRYGRALDVLDNHIDAETSCRLAAAHTRMDVGELPLLAEFDAIRGLVGIGAYLRHRGPESRLLRDILLYLVRLTEPVEVDGELLPGWWATVAPSGRLSDEFPGGHANTGMAHGIAGPLALLALTAVDGVAVDGQLTAIARICAWLDRWRQDGGSASWWPYWITRAQLRGDEPVPSRPSRPSWCYGTGGVARAQQLAGLALGDDDRRQIAENALLGAITDQHQQGLIVDSSLCHGHAGLQQIAVRCAADADVRMSASLVRPLLGLEPDAEHWVTHLVRPPGGRLGFLEGAAGVALALHTACSDSPPISGWDSCLLIA
ncbi:lanthionine synthetase C family protein [Actinomadura chibensis]|uniref:Lanthionine synthetase C family protein n=1 Tax=Actinomadura chibensis TaxID=392828 RepID=A0A5D0N9L9_9ACTN|nr:lanthionine synthetase C family protein [Actinomadura chibensis]